MSEAWGRIPRLPRRNDATIADVQPVVQLPIVSHYPFATMKQQDTLTVLSEFLKKRENIDPARVTPEALLEELKVDSLLLLELLFEFEDRLGVKIPQDIPRPTTVGDLLGIVDKITAGKGV
jgi:acyl carrier protein